MSKESLNQKRQLWHNVCRTIDENAKWYQAEVGPRLSNVFDVTDAVMREVYAAMGDASSNKLVSTGSKDRTSEPESTGEPTGRGGLGLNHTLIESLIHEAYQLAGLTVRIPGKQATEAQEIRLLDILAYDLHDAVEEAQRREMRCKHGVWAADRCEECHSEIRLNDDALQEIVKRRLMDCSTTDFHDISEDGVSNMAMLAVQVLRPYLRSSEREYRPHPDTALSVRIKNAIYALNLKRPDIAALPDGATISCNITTSRTIGALLEDLLNSIEGGK